MENSVIVEPGKIQSGFGRKVKNHASFAQTTRDSLTMAYRGLLKLKRKPDQFIDVLIFPIISTLMFTYMFGGAIAGNVASYLPYIIPAIILQTVLQASVTTGVQLRDDMDKGVFDRFKSLPIARIAPLAGALIADIVRYVVALVIIIATSLIMGFRPEGGPLMVIFAMLFVMFCAWGLSWIFAFFGVIAKSSTAVQGISMMVMMPLTFLSNAFVPTKTLPDWLRWFADVNPMSHMISAVRDLINESMVSADFWWSLLGIAVIIAIFAPLALRAYMRKA